MIASQPRLWDAFRDGVAITCPGITPHLHRGPPVARQSCSPTGWPPNNSYKQDQKAKEMSYRSTVARQPESLRDTLTAAQAELAGLDLKPLASGVIAVTGVGASYAAAVVVAAELQRRGQRALCRLAPAR